MIDHCRWKRFSKEKLSNDPVWRTPVHKTWRFCFWFACLGVLLVLLNVASSMLNAPIVYAAPSAHAHTTVTTLQPANTAVTGPRVSPDLTPQPLSVGTWHAESSLDGPQISTLAPGSISPTGRTPGEQPDLRTATSQTILNPDGSWTLQAYGAPINYQDAQGHWQPIDPTLISDSSVAGYAYSNEANGWHVHFASQAGGPTLVEAQFPSVTSLETLQGATTVSAQVHGSQIVYPSVFPGTDLLYQVGSTTLEETLLLQNAHGPASYTFVYDIPGASAHQDAAGNVIFTDTQGNVLLVVGGLFMDESDANGQMLPTGLGSQAIQVSLTS